MNFKKIYDIIKYSLLTLLLFWNISPTFSIRQLEKESNFYVNQNTKKLLEPQSTILEKVPPKNNLYSIPSKDISRYSFGVGIKPTDYFDSIRAQSKNTSRDRKKEKDNQKKSKKRNSSKKRIKSDNVQDSRTKSTGLDKKRISQSKKEKNSQTKKRRRPSRKKVKRPDKKTLDFPIKIRDPLRKNKGFVARGSFTYGTPVLTQNLARHLIHGSTAFGFFYLPHKTPLLLTVEGFMRAGIQLGNSNAIMPSASFGIDFSFTILFYSLKTLLYNKSGLSKTLGIFFSLGLGGTANNIIFPLSIGIRYFAKKFFFDLGFIFYLDRVPATTPANIAEGFFVGFRIGFGGMVF